MSCFSSTMNTTSAGTPDPAKHVNYNVGMVLGVDDFRQEFGYLSGRDQWMARDLIGYGTIRGLQVKTDVDAAKGPRVLVEPGVAVSPAGQLICVPAAQCAYLKDWVADNAKEVISAGGSPIASAIALYVVLCYRDCPADNVPIAGEPCRTEDQLMSPSRIKDDFCLELRTKKPNQREEESIRDFVAWLKQVSISDSGPSTPIDQFLNAIRNAAAAWFASSPPTSPPSDFMFGSPPALLRVQPSELCRYMSAALRLWVTELRPKWIGRWHGCAPSHFDSDSATDENCVLLAELEVPISPISPGTFTVPNAAVKVNDRTRPYVVHLRMLQEWLVCGVAGSIGSPPSGGGSGTPGKDGKDGLPGKDGKDGLPGKDGKDGLPGKDGKDGLPGKDGKDGTAVAGDFVERPKGLPSYEIVAAGIVNGNGTEVLPVYNQLQMRGTVAANGDFILIFKGYRPPDPRSQLIVKALLMRRDAQLRLPLLTVKTFSPEGIVMNLTDAGAPIQPAILQQLGIMVEISRFEAAAA